MRFEDHFSEQAQDYARHRPSYPDALFDYLASLAPARERAWDCGTGNGQAALALAARFRQVIATDASPEQIQNAFAHERVDYRVERAEATTIGAGSVDLVAAGTAVHWFDFDAFYEEVRRVGKARTIVAVWTYYFPLITPGVDRWLQRYYAETLDGFWPERIRYLEARYRTLPFPFAEIEPPAFQMEADWELDDFLGFIASWSATRKFLDARGERALDGALAELAEAWGPARQKRAITWPLYCRIGRLPA
jgi:hypothetical protein